MKAVFIRIFTYFLIGVVFLSSTGFGLIEHTCFIRNKKSASFFEEDTCCARKTTSKKEGAVLSNASCCDTETHVATFDLAPVVEKVAGFLSHVFFAVINGLVDFFQGIILSGQAIYQSADSSPPLTGRQLLIRYHSLQI